MYGNSTIKNFPQISFVVPTSDNGSSLEQTLSSIVNQNYPNCEIVLIINSGSDSIKRILQKFSGYITTVIEEEGLCYFESLQRGFEQCSGSLMTWIDPGSVFINKGLWAVRNIFENHLNVKWITGIPVFLNQQRAVVIEPEGFHTRWDLDRLMTENIQVIKRELAGGNVFWRKSLWEQTGGSLELQYQNLADVSLWKTFFEKASLTTAMVYLSAHPLQEKWEINWNKEAENLQLEQSKPQGFIDKILYSYYKFDLPYLGNFFPGKHPRTEVLKYDYAADSFYISHR